MKDMILLLQEGWNSCLFFWKLSVVVFSLGGYLLLLHLISQIKQLWKVHQFFSLVLKIDQKKLSLISWVDVVSLIFQIDSGCSSSILEVNQEILRFDNFLIAMINSPNLLCWKLPFTSFPIKFPISHLFINYFKFIIKGVLIDDNGCFMYSDDFQQQEMIRSFKLRSKLFGVLLLIVSPFIFIFSSFNKHFSSMK
jgi:hypothetical protein